MKAVYFKTDTSEPTAFVCTRDGRIDFSEVGREFGLDPTSIKLNGLRFPETQQYTWAEMDEFLKQKGRNVGQENNPVIVTGQAPVLAVSTGQGVQPGTPAQQVFWQNLPKAQLKTKKVRINWDADNEVEGILGNQDDADMGKAKVPKIEVRVTILELQDNSTFMGVWRGMSRIMVPKFYDDLWAKAERLIDERSTGVVRMLITGTPGTGKSVMAWYFIYKLREKLRSFQLVYQHQGNGRQTLYSVDGKVTSAPTASDLFAVELDSEDTVYVVDGAGAVVRNAMTFVFVSFDFKAFWEFSKEPGTVKKWSKVWSKIDILAARQLLFKDIRKSLVLDLYKKWGGVPRHVLEKAKDVYWQGDLDSKFKSVSSQGWLDLVRTVGGLGRPKNDTDVVKHYRTEDYERVTVVFASRYISECAFSVLQRAAWTDIVQFLKREDSESAGFRGQLFELAAHQLLMQKCSVRVRSLEETGRSEKLSWPALKRQEFAKVQDVKDAGSVGCYWCPVSKTNPTFDAVCTSIGAALGTSAALQMTISKDHGIKHEGLVKLLQAVPSVKRFYFVVPPSIFGDFRKQPFCNQDSQKQPFRNQGSQKRRRTISETVSGVEQWALEVDLDYGKPVQA